MVKIVCVLYDDPVDGYPSSYARDDFPSSSYPGGQTLPTPKALISTLARSWAASLVSSG